MEFIIALRSDHGRVVSAKGKRRQIQRALTNGHERNVTGEDGRQHKASADPLNHCTSLDLPLDVEDSGSTTMGEQQEDPEPALPPGSTAAA